jgi:hypothetical protein
MCAEVCDSSVFRSNLHPSRICWSVCFRVDEWKIRRTSKRQPERKETERKQKRKRTNTHSRTPVSKPPIYPLLPSSLNVHASTGARWSNWLFPHFGGRCRCLGVCRPIRSIVQSSDMGWRVVAVEKVGGARIRGRHQPDHWLGDLSTKLRSSRTTMRAVRFLGLESRERCRLTDCSLFNFQFAQRSTHTHLVSRLCVHNREG